MNNTDTGKTGIPLYLLGGFLGSGKTSLLNSILSLYKGQNAGVIINEFGEMGVDSSFIPRDSGIKVSELNGGQIFCSCLSGSFIKSITAYKDTDIQVLLVEASGLAKPSPLNEIITLARKTGDYFFDYRGMIGVVDAERFEILDKTLMTIGEQVTYSDSILINKIDLVDENTVERIKIRLKELNPNLRIKTTTFGRIDKNFLSSIGAEKSGSSVDETRTPGNDPKWSGWGIAGRPRTVSLIPESPVSKPKLQKFLSRIASETFRIKGFLPSLEGGFLKVDCTGANIKIENSESGLISSDKGIVILVPGDSELPEKSAEIWKEEIGTASGTVL